MTAADTTPEEALGWFAEPPGPELRTAVPSPAAVEEIARSLPLTQWSVDALSPYEWMRLADYLTGLLGRRPLKDGTGYWIGVRIVLGGLAAELRQNAIAAGEPAEIVEDPTPEWIAWEKRMDHEWSRANDSLLHRPKAPHPLTSDRPTAAPVAGSA